jgi:hypothetical protein
MLGGSTEIGCPDISGCTTAPVRDRVLAIAISVGGHPALCPKKLLDVGGAGLPLASLAVVLVVAAVQLRECKSDVEKVLAGAYEV